MPYAHPDEWLFEDWKLIATALQDAKHNNCRCYQCDTIDSLIEDIGWYWDLNMRELEAGSVN